MMILLTAVHVLVCVFLVIVVLLQSGKAADLAGAFGGMGSQTAFGPRGAATVLSKATTIAAGLFMVTSLSLSILATRGAGKSGSVLERAGKSATQQQKGGTAAPAGQGGAQQGQPVIPNNPGAQPTVEFVNEKGDVVKKQPLDLNNAPKVDPNNPVIPPSQPQQPEPAKKK
jgi:preprotein translocase subunit SecG